LTTYKDLIDHTLDWAGANPGGDAQRDARRAVQNAYRDLASRHRWSMYYTRGRLAVSAPYSTGTVSYFDSSGPVPRQVVLTGGTWPSWAVQGNIVMNNTIYQIATMVDAQNLILSINSNPGPAGDANNLLPDSLTGVPTAIKNTTNWVLTRDTYPLPVDCQAIDRMILVNFLFSLTYDHPSVWLERQRIYHSPAIPRTYTIRGDPQYQGALAVSFFPPPDDNLNFDFLYQRRPRRLVKEAISAGTASVTLGGLTVTGVGTNWISSMIGSVLRLGGDSINLPTGITGDFPAQLERIIVAVASPTSLTIDLASDQTLTGVTHLISDPADIEEAAMLTALFRACESQFAQSRSMDGRDKAMAAYKMALIEAMEVDARNMAASASGGDKVYPYRLAQMPRGPDIS
jgi:hypothetical protein